MILAVYLLAILGLSAFICAADSAIQRYTTPRRWMPHNRRAPSSLARRGADSAARPAGGKAAHTLWLVDDDLRWRS